MWPGLVHILGQREHPFWANVNSHEVLFKLKSPQTEGFFILSVRSKCCGIPVQRSKDFVFCESR